MMTTATPFLMFQGGKGEAAIDFYVATVPGSRVVSIERFAAGDPGPEGTIKRAVFEIAGQQVMVHDSFVTHGFDFTPSFSFFVDCADADEVDRQVAPHSEARGLIMPHHQYRGGEKFGWVSAVVSVRI